MNQYGQPYSPAAFQSQPSLPVHELPQHTGANPSQIQPTQQTPDPRAYDLAQESYKHNRNAIPGLGLGFTGHPLPARPPTAAGTTPHHVLQALPAAQNQVVNYPNTDMSRTAWVPPADADLSEGELEDIYEPFDDQVGPPKPSVDTAERGASYSPRLSSVEDMQDEPPAGNTSMPPSAANGSALPLDGHVKELSATETVEKARRDARDAVLSLNLLHVKYDTYRHTGVERSILESLFQELGLALDWPTEQERTPVVEQTEASSAVNLTLPPTTQRTSKSASPPPASRVPKETSPSSTKKDKSEERKDRIARLLAAKNSRQTSTVQSVAVPTTVEPSPPPPPPPQKSLEKSKLLQQKMEALRKAREAKAETVARIESSLTSNIGSKDESTLNIASDTASSAVVSSVVMTPLDQPLTPGLSSLEPPAGLPEASVGPGLQVPRGKRPVASDFDPLPQAKRPFSQTQSARPFRIEVSDDEDDSDDDTEMAIESPEQRPTVLSRQATGEAALRNHPPLSDLPNRSYSSPVASGEKPAQSPGREDLSRMHKDIEEMKRRIAEAEARKKARLSRQGTPLQSQASSRSDAQVDRSESGAKSAQETTSITGTDSKAARISSPSDHANSSENGIPQRRTLSRSMSRSTNERLAAIEAERKRKELKMRILQAQIAQMEREMEASLQEESELRERDETESVEEDNNASPDDGKVNVFAQPPVKGPPTDGMPHPDPPIKADATRIDTSHPDVVSDHVAPAPIDELRRHDDAVIADELKSADSPLDPAVNTTGDTELRAPALDVDDTAMEDLPSQGSESSDEDTSSSEVSEGSEGDEASEDEGLGSPDTANEVVVNESGREHTPSINESSPSPASSHVSPVAEGNNAENSTVQVQVPAEEDRVNHENEVSNRDETDAIERLKESQSNFRPYESPLQYFHAYRFHPEFGQTVKGGLRSLTYSNKIDVRQQICPDELLGHVCPRGTECDFQHLDKIAAPDDQILMQLGAYGAHEGEQQEEFNAGLRKLLQDFKNRESKDFQAISQAIIDYRAQFHGDKTKILPLGNVSL